MHCEFCGKTIPDGSKFCPGCGKKQPEAVHEHVMDSCPYCGSRLEADSVFCEKCGRELPKQDPTVKPLPPEPETRLCPYCGTKQENDAVFCEKCGKKLSGEPAAAEAARVKEPNIPPAPAPSRTTSPKLKEKKKKSGCSPILIIILILLAAAGYFLRPRYGYKVTDWWEDSGLRDMWYDSRIRDWWYESKLREWWDSRDGTANLVPTPVTTEEGRSTPYQIAVRSTDTPVPVIDQRPTTLPPVFAPATSVPNAATAATAIPFVFPTNTPAPVFSTAAPIRPQDLDYENFQTSEHPRQEDFLWVTEEILYGNLPGGRVRLNEIPEVFGGWKVYIVDDPDNRFGPGMERMCSANVDFGQRGTQITFHWYYVYNRNTKEVNQDFSPDSIFPGTWNNGKMELTGPGMVEMTEFYYLNGKEYAVGTLYWPDGIKGAVFMVRP